MVHACVAMLVTDRWGLLICKVAFDSPTAEAMGHPSHSSQKEAGSSGSARFFGHLPLSQFAHFGQEEDGVGLVGKDSTDDELAVGDETSRFLQVGFPEVATVQREQED